MNIFKELAWPTSCRIELLKEALGEEILEKLINHFMDKSEAERMIRLPKRQTIRKLIAYHFGKKVYFGEMSWSEVLKQMREKGQTLKELNLSKKEMMRLFEQRKKEIENERSK